MSESAAASASDRRGRHAANVIIWPIRACLAAAGSAPPESAHDSPTGDRPFALALVRPLSWPRRARSARRQPPPPRTQQHPTFRARIDSISVDVSVTDKQGRPVTDLKPEDFEIREASKPQTIDSFSCHRGGPEHPTSIATRHITSLQDQQTRGGQSGEPAHHHLSRRLSRARRATRCRSASSLALFVRQLSPRDLVAVLYPLTPIAAADVLAQSRRHGRRRSCKFTGRKYDYQPKNDYEQQFANVPPEVMEQMRNELTIRALTSACVFMGSMREGRKIDSVRERRHDGHVAGRRAHHGHAYLPGR